MRPLEGVRVLDFTHVLAGPFATRILGDLGADVVKVNSIERASVNAAGGPYYVIFNRNKRALALNMTHQVAKDVAREMALKADIVIDNFSVGVLDRWGIGYDDVSESNRKVIYIQMSGMGAGGPHSNYVTYAPTIHALSGLTYLNGVKGRSDIGIGFSYNDHMAGLHAAVAILSAIENRNQTGIGQKIDLAQFEVGASLLGPTMLDYFANGVAAEPVGNKPPYDEYGPHGCYPCQAEGEGIHGERWIAIVCESEAQWQSLTQVMGNPDWVQDTRFGSNSGRYQNRDELDSAIGEWTTNQEAYALMDLLQSNGVPAGVVQSGIDMVERDPQLKRTRFLRLNEGLHPQMGATFADRLPLYFEKTPCDVYKRTRVVGEDNAEVLADWLGLSPEEVEKGEVEGFLT